MKILIIGGVAGGASTAARLRRLDEKSEIIIFERGKNISFANCGIPYYCGDVIQDRSALELLTPQKIQEILNIQAKTESEVIKINREKKTILVKDLKADNVYEESYDRLVLSPGAKPVVPPIPGIENSRIFTVRNLENAEAIKSRVKNAREAVVIGAGYIGLEIAENLAHYGLKVSIVEKSDQVLNNADPEIALQLENHLQEKGVEVYLENGAESFEDGEKLAVKLDSGKILHTDLAVLAIGVKPENNLAFDAGLEIGKNGGIRVNEYLQTSDPDIYAVGDAIEVKDMVSGYQTQIPLAGPASKQGRIAAANIAGIQKKYETTLGTAILKLFDLTAGITGNNEKQLKQRHIPYLKTYVHDFCHANYYPGAAPLSIKLLFSPEDGKILGAQVIGKKGVDKRIDVLATAIKFNKTAADLIDLELSYAPPYGSAKDPVNIAGMSAENILNNFITPVYWDEVQNLPKNTFILDVRADEDLKKVPGSLDGTYRIPLEEIRSRVNEIPTDRKILVYCAKGLKSYFASRALIQLGFKDVISLNGGYMSIKHGRRYNKKEVLQSQ